MTWFHRTEPMLLSTCTCLFDAVWQVLPLLRTGAKVWQPSDFLPVSSDPDFEDQVGNCCCCCC
jgi:hypothetical protein